MRQPIAAGHFYPKRKDELERLIKKMLEKKPKNANLKACIVPHAGYKYSGKIAGKVASIIPYKKNFIMLGVNHSGTGNKISASIEKFETPFGIIDSELGKVDCIVKKLKSLSLDCEINETSHMYEHSLEVQLPILQKTQGTFCISPIILKDLSPEECKKIAQAIAAIIDDNDFILVSSDFTHYGKGYNFIPFDRPESNFEKFDKDIINEIMRLNPKNFYNKSLDGTVCGSYGITILLEIAKIKGWKPQLIDYATSSQVSNDWSHVVGYAGIVFE